MAVVALLALGLASPDPILAVTLIVACPLWMPVIVKNRGHRPAGDDRPPPG
jgi:hypothetical protein